MYIFNGFFLFFSKCGKNVENQSVQYCPQKPIDVHSVKRHRKGSKAPTVHRQCVHRICMPSKFLWCDVRHSDELWSRCWCRFVLSPSRILPNTSSTIRRNRSEPPTYWSQPLSYTVVPRNVVDDTSFNLHAFSSARFRLDKSKPPVRPTS